MAYCVKCGTEVVESAQYCHNCGLAVPHAVSQSGADAETRRAAPTAAATNRLAMIGLILGIASVFLSFIGVIPLLGLGFSFAGLMKAGSREGKGLLAALIGLALSAVFTVTYLYQYGHLR